MARLRCSPVTALWATSNRFAGKSPPMSIPTNTNGRTAVAAAARQPTPAGGTPIVPIRCPHCGRTASAEGRFFLQGPHGPVERLRIACPAGHWLIPHGEPRESRWAGT
jgi:hypothetical protein